MKEFFPMLAHPYSRYGLATAVVQSGCRLADIKDRDQAFLSEILLKSLETGLDHFRMQTFDIPEHSQTLEFRAISFNQLQQETYLVQSKGLAEKGKYLFPSAITTDGGANDTYKNAVSMLESLRKRELLLGRNSFSRSFAPMSSKINQNGRPSLSEPPTTLFEAACCAITTLTPLKPAAWLKTKKDAFLNTCILPDLPFDENHDELWQFIRLFEEMSLRGPSGLMVAQLADPSSKALKQQDSKVKPKYKRPLLHSGNYPYAPRQSDVLGVAGLLGAIGRWAYENNEIPRGKNVLETLKNCPFYLVNDEGASQVQFSHHVVKLAQENKLSVIVPALSASTRLYSEMEQDRPQWDDTSRKLYTIFASRFLQLFSEPAFKEFLSTRAEYPEALIPLFKEYYTVSKIPEDIVHSAQALGRWINYAAYKAAEKEVKEDNRDPGADLSSKIRRRKADILVALDSMAMGARTPSAMIGSILRETMMLSTYDAPSEALPFINAANIGDERLPMDTARQLIMTYMRVASASFSEKQDKAGTHSDDINPTALQDQGE